MGPAYKTGLGMVQMELTMASLMNINLNGPKVSAFVIHLQGLIYNFTPCLGN